MIPQVVNVPKVAIVDKVSLPSSKSAVVVVDMQNDFAHPNGRLYSPSAREIIPRIATLINKARSKGVKVVYTQDTHFEDDAVEFPIWGPHVVKGTWGWEIVEELKPTKGDVVIEKMRYDAFFGTPMDHVLRMYGIQHLVVVGTVANICVLHTVASARLRLYDVVVPIDAIAALNEFDYDPYSSRAPRGPRGPGSPEASGAGRARGVGNPLGRLSPLGGFSPPSARAPGPPRLARGGVGGSGSLLTLSCTSPNFDFSLPSI